MPLFHLLMYYSLLQESSVIIAKKQHVKTLKFNECFEYLTQIYCTKYWNQWQLLSLGNYLTSKSTQESPHDDLVGLLNLRHFLKSRPDMKRINHCFSLVQPWPSQELLSGMSSTWSHLCCHGRFTRVHVWHGRPAQQHRTSSRCVQRNVTATVSAKRFTRDGRSSCWYN